MAKTPAPPAVVARAHQLADELGRAMTLSDFCAVVARPDFAATLRALEADGGYPDTTKSMREAVKICRAAARPGAPPGHPQRGTGPGARAVAPPGQSGTPGARGKAPSGPVVGPQSSPGGRPAGSARGKPGGTPGGSDWGLDWLPSWLPLVVALALIKGARE